MFKAKAIKLWDHKVNLLLKEIENSFSTGSLSGMDHTLMLSDSKNRLEQVTFQVFSQLEDMRLSAHSPIPGDSSEKSFYYWVDQLRIKLEHFIDANQKSSSLDLWMKLIYWKVMNSFPKKFLSMSLIQDSLIKKLKSYQEDERYLQNKLTDIEREQIRLNRYYRTLQVRKSNWEAFRSSSYISGYHLKSVAENMLRQSQ